MREKRIRKTNVSRRSFVKLAGSYAGLLAMQCSSSHAQNLQDGVDARELNRIAVVVDRTRSFEHLHDAAGRKVKTYLNDMALGSSDTVYLIAMEATPEQVGYFPGTFFTSSQQNMLREKLGNCYDGIGTDVVGSLELAVQVLNQSPQVGGRHLLVFSDCFVDNEKDPSGKTLRTFPRLEDWDWTKLHGIHTELYYLGTKPYDVKARLLKLPAVSNAAAKGDLILWNHVESDGPNCKPQPPMPPARIDSQGSTQSPILWLGLGVGAIWLFSQRQQTQRRVRRNPARRAD